jgi:hypothetical protein
VRATSRRRNHHLCCVARHARNGNDNRIEIFKSIWATPGKFGANPTNSTSAATPPMVADVGDLAQTTVPVAGASPSSIAPVTGPCRVKKSEMKLPAGAGLPGELPDPSEFTAAACPLTVNKAGAAALSEIVLGADSVPLTRATMLAGPAPTSLAPAR